MTWLWKTCWYSVIFHCHLVPHFMSGGYLNLMIIMISPFFSGLLWFFHRLSRIYHIYHRAIRDIQSDLYYWIHQFLYYIMFFRVEMYNTCMLWIHQWVESIRFGARFFSDKPGTSSWFLWYSRAGWDIQMYILMEHGYGSKLGTP